MSYKIECVIQELQCDASGKLTGLKIKGSDGYLLKQGDKEYNVFCPDNMPGQTANSFVGVQVLSVDAELSFAGSVSMGLSQILAQAKYTNKKVRLIVNQKKGVKNITPKTLEVEQISIL